MYALASHHLSSVDSCILNLESFIIIMYIIVSNGAQAVGPRCRCHVQY